jgi:DNA-binding protein H-NS
VWEYHDSIRQRRLFAVLQWLRVLVKYSAAVRLQVAKNRRLLALRQHGEVAALCPEPVKMANPSKPKYRDPAKPECTWAGKGKQPGWLKEKLEAGAKLEDFLVDKPTSLGQQDDPGF